MPVVFLNAAEALSRLGEFDAIIDARSEDEHALDHVPGAVNWPTLNNAERIEIGTLHRENPFEARKRGAAYAARNIAAHIERELLATPKGWRPLVYCWRGGNRSGALATILGTIGFQVTLVEGGYKAWRAALVEDLPGQAAGLNYRVLCGPTGSGKTRLLQALAAEGAQVLDLEALACHRSSVLGLLPGQPQPSQKRFDTLVWDALRRFDPARPVYVESESKKVGNLRVPDPLMGAMRASDCISLQVADEERVALLLEDYAFFVQQPDFFIERLQALRAVRGAEVVNAWAEQVRAGDVRAVVRDLLVTHYDPMYLASTQRNFQRLAHAQPCVLQDRGEGALRQAARSLLAGEAAAASVGGAAVAGLA